MSGGLLSFVGALFTVPVSVGLVGALPTTPTSALIDSAASRCFVDSNTCPSRYLLPTPLVFRPAQGPAFTVTEASRFVLRLGDHVQNVDAYVLVNAPAPVLLGADFLEENGAVLDFATRTITIPAASSTCLSLPAPEPVSAPALVSVPAPFVSIPVSSSTATATATVPAHAPVSARPVATPVTAPTSMHHRRRTPQTPRPLLAASITVGVDSIVSAPFLATLAAVALASPAAIPDEYNDYAFLFDPARAERLPAHRPGFDFQIELQPGARPVPEPPRRLSPDRQAVLDQYVEDGLRKGYLELCFPPFSSPATFARKSDGSLRPCFDFRRLNAITQKVAYPAPDAGLLIDGLRGATVFTKFDLTAAFHQLRVSPESADWTAFPCNGKTYRHLVMPFGLVNAPAYFQALVNHVLAPLRHCAGGYADDIIVFSKTREEHVEHVRAVLAALAANDLYLSAKKCTFHQSSVAFLGVLISPDGVSIDPSKIKAVQDWARPTNVTGIQELIGTANFVRRHIKDFSTLVRPLTLLTRKTVPFVWTDACERAFQGLKEALTSAPVLAFPDHLNRTKFSRTPATWPLALSSCKAAPRGDARWRTIHAC